MLCPRCDSSNTKGYIDRETGNHEYECRDCYWFWTVTKDEYNKTIMHPLSDAHLGFEQEYNYKRRTCRELQEIEHFKKMKAPKVTFDDVIDMHEYLKTNYGV